MPDHRELPAARPIGCGSHQFGHRSQGAQPLPAPEHLDSGGGEVAQPSGAFVAGARGQLAHPRDGRRQRGVVGAVDQRRGPRGSGRVVGGADAALGRARRHLPLGAPRPVLAAHTDAGRARSHAGEPCDQTCGLEGVGAGAQRPHRPVGPWAAHHRQPRERLLAHADPPPPLRKSGPAVVGRGVGGEQAQLANPGLQGVCAFDVVHTLRQGDHLTHPRPRVGAVEVLRHPPVQVGRGADVEHLGRRAAEQIDPGAVRQPGGERAFGTARGRHPGQIAAKVRQSLHTLVSHPFDKRMQDVDAGAGVIEGPVGRLRRRPHQACQGPQSHARRLLAAQHPACEPNGAQHREPRPRKSATLRRGPQESGVESGVVRDQHCAPCEFEEHGQYRLDPRGVTNHRGGDPGQFDDLRGNAASGIDQGREFRDHLARAHLDRADLGDRVEAAVGAGSGPPAGGLEVDDDEGDVAQRRGPGATQPVAEFEAQLRSCGGAGHGCRR